MESFLVTLDDGTVEIISGADAYQAEGPLTTFFLTDGSNRSINSWSERLGSVRTAEIRSIRRIQAAGPEDSPEPDGRHPDPVRPAATCRQSNLDSGRRALAS